MRIALVCKQHDENLQTTGDGGPYLVPVGLTPERFVPFVPKKVWGFDLSDMECPLDTQDEFSCVRTWEVKAV